LFNIGIIAPNVILETTFRRSSAQDEQISSGERKLPGALRQNTELTTGIPALAKVIHDIVGRGKETWALVAQ
jgi:hypothetical protein